MVERRFAFGKEDKEELRTSAARLEGIELARRFGMIEVAVQWECPFIKESS